MSSDNHLFDDGALPGFLSRPESSARPDRFASRVTKADEPSPRPTRRPRNFAEALAVLARVFDNLEALQLQHSVLKAEQTHAELASEKMLEGAFTRIEDLEAVVAGLMRIVAKYDTLLSQSNGRRKEAEQRAAHAEVRVRETERGASEAVEWLYRYMAESLHPSR